MVRIWVTSREQELLERIFDSKKLYIYSSIDGYEVQIKSLVELNFIINEILDYFLKNGLYTNDEPNELGFELENLNTKFIRELQKINDKENKKDK